MLLIDTSTSACTVALFNSRSQTLVSRQVIKPQGHTHLILPLIEELLAESAMSKKEIDRVAYVAGPGSFTGLRIGVSVAQGLAYALGAKVLGVSAYQALERQFSREQGRPAFVIGDARMGDLYVRDGLSNTPHDQLMSLQQFSELVNSYELHDNFAIIGGAKDLLTTVQLDQYFVDGYEYPQAQSLIDIALEASDDHWQEKAYTAQPLYLRNEVNWQKRIKKADAWAAKNA